MKRLMLIAALPFYFYGSIAFAGSKTQTFNPTATVSNVCVIQSTDNLSFGSYVPSNAAALQTSGQIKLICTKGATATVIPISGGSAMSGAGGNLNYTLYTDSGFSKGWGSPGALNASVNFASNVSFSSNVSGLTLAQCTTAANGLLYAYTPLGYYNSGGTYASVCQYGYVTTGGSSVASVTGTYNSGLVVGGKTIVAASYNANKSPTQNATFYAPSGTQVSGYVYSVPTSMSGQLSLSQTSTGVGNVIAMTYYGQVPAKQDVAPGAYTDTVTVQVTF